VIERIVEEVSFNASDSAGGTFVVTADYVKTRIGDLLVNADLRKYIL
jgi:ATP-dependent HslUV protease ATP-binding subunit HslU